MKVILKNGDGLSLEEGARCSDAAKAINESLARNAVAAKVNGALCDLSHELQEGDKLELLTLKDHEGLEVYPHPFPHERARAVETQCPHSELAIGP